MKSLKRPVTDAVPGAFTAVSPSKLNALACPYRYQKVFLEGEPEPASLILELGSLIHDVAAEYFAELKASGDETNHRVLDAIADKKWADRHPVIPEHAIHDYRTFVDELRSFHVEGKVAGVEQRLAFDDHWNRVPWESDHVAFGGIVDYTELQDEGRLIHARDWTTAALGGQYTAEKDLQLRFYAMLIFRLTGHGRVRITVHSLRTGAQASVDLDQEDHAETEERVRSERNRACKLGTQVTHGEELLAIPGHNCAICQLACPYELATGDKVQLTAEEMQGAHGDYIVLERRRKQLRESLKSHVAVHGSIESQGVIARFDPMKKYSWDALEVVEMLRADSDLSDAEIFSMFNLDRRQMNRLLKQDAETLMAVEELAQVKHTERFKPDARLKKERADDD